MASATDLIKKAMQDLAVLGAGKSPTANDLTDCRSRLNDMIDSWSTSSILVPFRTQVSHTLNGSQSYTIGSGGDINTTRPTYIDSAYVNDGSNDYDLMVLRDRSAYDRIVDKSITGTPRFVYYEPSVPLGKVFVYYVGDSSHTLYFNTRGQLTQFTDNTTDVDLAIGYDRAISSNLALEIAPMYEVSASPELIKKAAESLAMIKRLNRQIPIMQFDPAVTSTIGYNIETDE